MTSLLEYDVLLTEVFYRCWHILEYIENHPDMDELEREAIKATIMDALVTRKLINPEHQSLDLDKLCIVDNLEHYVYNPHPNICGIPLWMKEKFRTKAIKQSAGLPLSVYLSRPPSKYFRACVYDPNTAVSSIFDDATFYNCFYNSPTRGIRIESQRPFVEVEIDGVLYLVDTLTKRILKSSWFKENYDFESVGEYSISTMQNPRRQYYQEMVEDSSDFAVLISMYMFNSSNGGPQYAEMRYELEQTKINYPEQWEQHEEMERKKARIDNSDILSLIKNMTEGTQDEC